MFQNIGFHAALILNKLRIERAISGDEQHPSQKPKSSPKQHGEKNPDEQRNEINRRLADLAEMERRLAADRKGRG